MMAKTSRTREQLRRRFRISLTAAIPTFIVYLYYFDFATMFAPMDHALQFLSIGMVAVFGPLTFGLWIAACSNLAQSRGYSKWWGILGIFAFFGLAPVFLLPQRWIEPESSKYLPGDYPRLQG